MVEKLGACCLVAVATVGSGTAAAAARPAQSSALPPILPAACEAELALSAAPEDLRADAAVYVLTSSGYEVSREGSNGFTCIVNRDHPYVLKPTCFDAEGSAAIVPKIIRFGELLTQGLPLKEIQQDIETGFKDGRFVAPGRAGVAYMLSNYNRPYSAQSDTLGWFPPHVMFYAPELTGDDIGFSASAWRANRRLPFIGYQGPHGFMIVTTEDAADATRTSLPSCPAWLADDQPWVHAASETTPR